MNNIWLRPIEPLLRPLDLHFARFVLEQNGEDSPLLELVAALTSYQLGQGHVCLPLRRIAGLYKRLYRAAQKEQPESDVAAALSSPEAWQTLLSEQAVVGLGGERPVPIVLEHNRLYLHRYWRYEAQIATDLAERAEPVAVEPTLVNGILERLFASDQSEGQTFEVNWQKVACAVAASRRFAVISGGPGTGKTTTVVRLLALLVELAGGQPVTIRLAAPTGKAAARLRESITGARGKLACSEAVQAAIPDQAMTLHRLLGARPGSVHFRHNRDNPLHLDILVVDEASMIDLPMMTRLLAAMPKEARLILLGDRDQLASVEAGSVLADICGRSPGNYAPETASQLAELTGYPASALQAPASGQVAPCLALLRKSWRFAAASGIGELARAVNNGDQETLGQVLQQPFADINFFELSRQSYEQLLAQAVAGYSLYLQPLIKMQAADDGAAAAALLAAFSRYQVLCALREGEFGVTGLNLRVEQALGKAGLIHRDSDWYAGRPIIITRNDKGLGLANGDIGLTIPDSHGRLRVWFDDGETGPRAILPSRLPHHETVYAMTVHRSQGSEFERVAMVLPPQPTPVLTRELVYTGITRARQQFDLYGFKSVLKDAVTRPTQRDSGLELRLH